MRLATLVAIAMLFAGTDVFAQDVSKATTRRPRDASQGDAPLLRTGRTFESEVYVGEPAPDFGLDDIHGKEMKLSRFRGTWVVLAFGDVGEEVTHLRVIESYLNSLGARLVTVCHEKVTSLRKQSDDLEITFPMLADVTAEISARYGLYDHIERRTTPGYFLLDPHGVVRLAVLGQGLPASQVAGVTRFIISGT